MSRLDPATEVFEAHRPRLARLAYRMLGSVAEAEDVVQNAWLRWRTVDPAEVRDARPRYAVEREEGDRIARAFFEASRSGDLATLSGLLAETATLRADGGGKVIAFHNPIEGARKLLRLFANLSRKYGPDAFQCIRPLWIDGLPGYASLERGMILQTTALAIEAGRIVDIFITRNPDKLAHVAAELGLAAPTPH